MKTNIINNQSNERGFAEKGASRLKKNMLIGALALFLSQNHVVIGGGLCIGCTQVTENKKYSDKRNQQKINLNKITTLPENVHILITEFLDLRKMLKMQLVSKAFYGDIIPKTMTRMKIQCLSPGCFRTTIKEQHILHHKTIKTISQDTLDRWIISKIGNGKVLVESEYRHEPKTGKEMDLINGTKHIANIDKNLTEEFKGKTMKYENIGKKPPHNNRLVIDYIKPLQNGKEANIENYIIYAIVKNRDILSVFKEIKKMFEQLRDDQKNRGYAHTDQHLDKIFVKLDTKKNKYFPILIDPQQICFDDATIRETKGKEYNLEKYIAWNRANSIIIENCIIVGQLETLLKDKDFEKYFWPTIAMNLSENSIMRRNIIADWVITENASKYDHVLKTLYEFYISSNHESIKSILIDVLVSVSNCCLTSDDNYDLSEVDNKLKLFFDINYIKVTPPEILKQIENSDYDQKTKCDIKEYAESLGVTFRQ